MTVAPALAPTTNGTAIRARRDRPPVHLRDGSRDAWFRLRELRGSDGGQAQNQRRQENPPHADGLGAHSTTCSGERGGVVASMSCWVFSNAAITPMSKTCTLVLIHN